MNKEELYKKAIKKWGCQTQVEMLKEECAELIVALCKYGRFTNGTTLLDIAEEIADVEIMIEQFKAMYPYTAVQKQVSRFKEQKLQRLNELLGCG